MCKPLNPYYALVMGYGQTFPSEKETRAQQLEHKDLPQMMVII